MTEPRTRGLHHVTAMATDAQANVDFYTRTLGLDLLKATVNFDDPSVWHFYYGPPAGGPGVITHFPFPNAGPGRRGSGETAAAAYAVAPGALDGWLARLDAAGVRADCLDRFGEPVVAFTDPDGLGLEIVGREGAPAEGPRSVQGVTLAVRDAGPTAAVLGDLLGLTRDGAEGARTRFRAPDGSHVDVLVAPDMPGARAGGGSIHHIAFRAADRDELALWRARVAHAGFDVTEIRDRQYFRSIYFREPGGVLFEIATDDPGFAVDESPQALGTALKLPDWLEPRRAAIRARLPAVRRPDGLTLP